MASELLIFLFLGAYHFSDLHYVLGFPFFNDCMIYTTYFSYFQFLFHNSLNYFVGRRNEELRYYLAAMFNRSGVEKPVRGNYTDLDRNASEYMMLFWTNFIKYGCDFFLFMSFVP